MLATTERSFYLKEKLDDANAQNAELAGEVGRLKFELERLKKQSERLNRALDDVEYAFSEICEVTAADGSQNVGSAGIGEEDNWPETLSEFDRKMLCSVADLLKNVLERAHRA